MKMRELERRTGVSRQMIQYYLSNGLLPEPARPKPNVAEYNEEHVRAIQTIRRLQTEGRLKIHEIKEALRNGAAPTHSGATVLPHLDELFALRAGIDTQLVPLNSLLERYPHAKKDALALANVGAVTLHKKGNQLFVSRIDSQVIGCWDEMRAGGLTEEEGFDPSIVELHVQSAAALVTREVEIFFERVNPDHPLEKKAAMANAGSNALLHLFTLLRMKSAVVAFRHFDELQ